LFGDLLAIIGFGVGGGLFGMLNILTWPKLYGRKHLGQISGFAMSVIVAGSAIGPWIFSVIQRFFGSYKGAGILGLIWCMLMIIMLVLTPFKPASSQGEQS
jgi:MFS family permease